MLRLAMPIQQPRGSQEQRGQPTQQSCGCRAEWRSGGGVDDARVPTPLAGSATTADDEAATLHRSKADGVLPLQSAAHNMALQMKWSKYVCLPGAGLRRDGPTERLSYPALTLALERHFRQGAQAFSEQMWDKLGESGRA